MKTRYLVTIALSAVLAYVLGLGCTQNFGAFQTCGLGQKVCGDACVTIGDPAFGCTGEGCTPCSLPNAKNACDKLKCGVQSCTGTFQNCNGADEDGCEADTANDPTQCGMCGHQCITPNAMPGCKSGACTIAMCDPTWDDCNNDPTDGCEASLQNDSKNCGKCGTKCPQFETCVAGKCTLSCPDGKGDCNNDPADGCETDLGTSQNCSMCGDKCDLAHANAKCAGGKCAIDKCDPGWADCDNNPANGCESDTQGSAMTCGGCGKTCPAGGNGTPVCDKGKCAINCNAGFGNCDGNLQNGCETDTSTSNTDCGACNQPCSPANGTGQCASGMCMVTGCTGTFKDCNGDPSDGCEADLTSNVGNCGMCGNKCSFANAGASCQNSMCVLGGCNMGFANCNNMPGDGCEVNLNTSTSNCGACGRACDSTNVAALSCAGGVCNSTCTDPYGNCSKPAAPAADDGCETNTGTDVANCGACGRACSGDHVAVKSCTGGVCDSYCALGFANCVAPSAPMNDNGCEVAANGNNMSGNANCGGCGNACSLQGGQNDKFECDGGPAAQKYCGCTNDFECRGANVSAGSAACGGGGLCQCGSGNPKTTCNPGEACAILGGNPACACNGAAACAAGQVCCETPAGCTDVLTDPNSCGACGHKCAPGHACQNGVCQ
jgi:hypothetical protein